LYVAGDAGARAANVPNEGFVRMAVVAHYGTFFVFLAMELYVLLE
jgi:hypothetical protein